MTNIITHIVIQTGYCVFGAGDSYESAIAEASKWMADESGKTGGYTVEQVAEIVEAGQRGVSGDFDIIMSDHKDFDSYLHNQGGFKKTDAGWIAR